MEAFVRPQNDRKLLEKRSDYLALVPAAWSVTTIAFMIIFSSVICLFGGNAACIDGRLSLMDERG